MAYAMAKANDNAMPKKGTERFRCIAVYKIRFRTKISTNSKKRTPKRTRKIFNQKFFTKNFHPKIDLKTHSKIFKQKIDLNTYSKNFLPKIDQGRQQDPTRQIKNIVKFFFSQNWSAQTYTIP